MGDAENVAALMAQQQQMQPPPSAATINNIRQQNSVRMQGILDHLKTSTPSILFRRRAAEELRYLLQSSTRAAVNELFKSQIMDMFCRLLKKTREDNVVLEQILWAITNLSHANSPWIHEMLPKGIVKHIVHHIRNSTALQVRDQAIMCLGNISTDCQMCRERVIETEVLETLLDFLQIPTNLTMNQRDTYAWTVQNIIRPANSDGEYKLSGQNRGKLLQAVYNLITLPAPDDSIFQGIGILHDWVMADSEKIVGLTIVGHEPLMRHLLQLFQADDDDFSSKIIRTIGNLAFNDDDVIQDIINYGFITAMHTRMISSGVLLEADIFWCMSNILGSLRETCIKSIYDREPLFESLIANCYNYETKIRREAIFCVINIVTYFKDSEKEQLYKEFFGMLIIQTLKGFTTEDQVSMCQAVQGILTHCCEEMKLGCTIFNDMIYELGLEEAIKARYQWIEENLPKHENGTLGKRELLKLKCSCIETLNVIESFKQGPLRPAPVGFVPSLIATPRSRRNVAFLCSSLQSPLRK